jgi:hypothetical protein
MNIFQTYLRCNNAPPHQLLDFYEALLDEIHAFYGDDTVKIDYYATKYYALMTKIYPLSKAHPLAKVYLDKMHEIQLRNFAQTKSFYSLYDILIIYSKRGDMASARQLILDNYDIFLHFKNFERTFGNKFYIPLVIWCFIKCQLECIGKDYYNEININCAVRRGYKFVGQKLPHEPDCGICMEIVEIGDFAVLCLQCKKIIGHDGCVREWLTKSGKCPLCRF